MTWTWSRYWTYVDQQRQGRNRKRRTVSRCDELCTAASSICCWLEHMICSLGKVCSPRAESVHHLWNRSLMITGRARHCDKIGSVFRIKYFCPPSTTPEQLASGRVGGYLKSHFRWQEVTSSCPPYIRRRAKSILEHEARQASGGLRNFRKSRQ